MKVSITNFQSIENVSFEIPEKQFTCIVGPSNIGKSALRRAFECLIYNKSEASYIRSGTKTCSVEVVFDDGTAVKWYRNKKTAGYVIDGDDFTKLAGTVPEILIDKGYEELQINKDKYQVQIASQFNNIFLLNQTGGKVTEVLSNLGNLNRIIKSNKACQSDMKANKSRLSVRREDVVSSKEKLKSYEGLDEQRKIVESLKSHLKDIKKIKDKVDSVKKVATNLDKSVTLVKALRPVKEVSVESFDLDINKLTASKKLSSKLIKSQEINKSYIPLKDIKDISFNLSTDTLVRLKSLYTKYNLGDAKQKQYTRLSEIESIDFHIKEEYDKYIKMLEFYKKIDIAKNKISLYRNLPETKLDTVDLDISKFKKLNDLYKIVIDTKSKVLRLREEATSTESKLADLNRERDDLHKSLGVCPLCDKEF